MHLELSFLKSLNFQARTLMYNICGGPNDMFIEGMPDFLLVKSSAGHLDTSLVRMMSSLNCILQRFWTDFEMSAAVYSSNSDVALSHLIA